MHSYIQSLFPGSPESASVHCHVCVTMYMHEGQARKKNRFLRNPSSPFFFLVLSFFFSFYFKSSPRVGQRSGSDREGSAVGYGRFCALVPKATILFFPPSGLCLLAHRRSLRERWRGGEACGGGGGGWREGVERLVAYQRKE